MNASLLASANPSIVLTTYTCYLSFSFVLHDVLALHSGSTCRSSRGVTLSPSCSSSDNISPG
eukprot:m.70341 g.70341  ORF g.70341 m.70341 type:complete len:62 (+) comp13775_c1_seq3:45-230(+)